MTTHTRPFNRRTELAAKPRIAHAIAAIVLCLCAASGALAQCPGQWITALGPGTVGTNNTVMAEAMSPSGSMYAGGAFFTAGGSTVNFIAHWTGSTWGTIPSIPPGTDDTVYAVAFTPTGDMILGGQFGQPMNSTFYKNIARWNGSAWSGIGGGLGSTAYAIAIMPNGDIIAGGIFQSAGIVTVSNIARWNGTVWSSMAGGTDGQVNALAVTASGDLIAGGTFTHAGGVPVNGVARWDGTAWHAMPGGGLFGVGVNIEVKSLAALPGGDVAVGGLFVRAGNTPASNIARWTPTGGGAWSAIGPGLGNTVWSIAVLPDGSILAGGDFTTDGTFAVSLGHIARWDGLSWLPYGTGLNNRVRALAPFGIKGDFYAGGDFTTAGGAASTRVAQWSAIAVPIITFQPSSNTELCGSTAQFFAAATDPAGVTYHWRKTGVALSNGATTSGSVISGVTTQALTITGVTASDAGDYDCLLTGTCSTHTSEAHLTVIRCCPADFNNSGTVTVQDIFAFLSAWFTGCP